MWSRGGRNRRSGGILMLLALFAAGCAMGGPSPVRYTGAAPSCGRIEGGGTTSTLTRLGGGFAFAPYDGSLIVNGAVMPGGAFAGTLDLHPARPDAAQAPAKPKPGQPAQAIAVSGRIAGEAATLSYAAPGCAATLTLARAHPPLL